MLKKIFLLFTLLIVLSFSIIYAYDWRPGQVDVDFYKDLVFHEVYNDFMINYKYYELELLDIWEYRNGVSFKFNNNIIGDEEFVELIKKDPTVSGARLQYYNPLPSPGEHFVYPNPSNGDIIRFDSYWFRFSNVELKIFNVRGQLIKKAGYNDLTPRKIFYIWDQTDMNGKPVAPGVYMYVIRVPGSEPLNRGRITILK